MKSNDKKKEMAKKMIKGEGKIKSRLKHIGGELKKERISYGELAELSNPKYKKHLYNDVRLAEASGMSEEEFRKHSKKK